MTTQAILLSSVCLAFFVHSIQASNDCPIVLVHGFSGWGREEFGGFKYWGGLQGDLEEQLKAQGHRVFTAAVGPFSSNWDRACELYAQIKGGQVDYGITHSRVHKHARFGRNHTGFYPEWGTVNADGSVNKVHLIGHSMGGQTIRMLAQLLAKGSKGASVEELESTSPLFSGGKDWVHSITTVSTPNRGTLLADGVAEVGDFVKMIAVGIFSLVGLTGTITPLLYDVKMDQWGLGAMQPTETLPQYLNRALDTGLMQKGYKDFCLWSLSTAGAAEESKWVETLPNVYYYSYANSDSIPMVDLLLRPIQVPGPVTMVPLLQPFGLFLGSRYGPNKGFPSTWQANDGVVNMLSMWRDAVGKARAFDGTSTMGQWNMMPQLRNLDHLAVIGTTLHTPVMRVYHAHAKLLASLPLKSENAAQYRHLLANATIESAVNITGTVNDVNRAAMAGDAVEVLKTQCGQTSDPFTSHYCASVLG